MLLLALAVAVSACGKDRLVYRWNEEVLAAGKIYDRGEYSEAEARYLELLESAPNDESRRYVLNELGRVSERRSDWERALGYYERVWKQPHDDEAGARALYRSGHIFVRHLGDAERGLDLMRQTIVRFGASVAAEVSVRELKAHYLERRDFDGLEREFTGLYEQTGDEPIADNLLFELALALEEEADQPRRALPHYRTVYEDLPEHGLADDALWQAAMIHQRHQSWETTVDLLSRLADDVQTSWFVGNYNSPWTSKARFELGMIHLLHLEDYPEAIAHFERFLSDFPTSILADDAAWHIVQLHRLKGDRSAYLSGLEDFVKDHPESRYVRQARERLAQEGRL
jgi:tetratricopeptide (TPR) repeat protein